MKISINYYRQDPHNIAKEKINLLNFGKFLAFAKSWIFLLPLASLLLASCGGGAGASSSSNNNLSIANVSASEDVGSMIFTVTLSATSDSTTSFYYRTEDRSAKAGFDYKGASGDASIKVGDTSVRIPIAIINDTSIEDAELFFVNILNSSADAAVIDRATGTIKIDELPSLSIKDSSIREGAGNLEFTVTLSAPFLRTNVSFDYETTDDSAIAGLDYRSSSGTAMISAEKTSTTIVISILDDNAVEDNETFDLVISNSANATIGKESATGTIKINDLSLFITDSSALEDAESLRFTVSLSAPFFRSISFDYRAIARTASANLDYTSDSSTASINTGDTTTEISIGIIDDELVEDNETFYLVISNVTPDIPISRERATGTIKIDELPSLTIKDSSIREGAGNLEFTVTLSEPFPRTNVSFDYETTDDSAIAGLDYIHKTETLTIPAGDTTIGIFIDILDDNAVEDNETFDLVISNPDNATIDKESATGTIKIDDLPTLSIANSSALESAGVVIFTASLSVPFPGNIVSFDYRTQSGSANNKIMWETVASSTRWRGKDEHTSLVFDNEMWILGGNGASIYVWNSVTGKPWLAELSPTLFAGRGKVAPTSGHTSLVFDNEMWILGGYYDSNYYNEVWNSANGRTWRKTLAAWSARRHHTSLVFDGRMWVLGGEIDNIDANIRNDVWNSINGRDWDEVKANTAETSSWIARRHHTSLVFDGRMWVLGGEIDNIDANRNDVWNSINGRDWDEVKANNTTDTNSWSTRHSHTSLVFDGKMWVLGGNDGVRQNDVWYSTDGKNWTEATPDAKWSPRQAHTSVAFDNKMWVLGGNDGDRTNDVYFADATGDYQSVSAKGSIMKGELSTDIEITIVVDNIAEEVETFDVIISNPIKATINTTSGKLRATGTIR